MSSTHCATAAHHAGQPEAAANHHLPAEALTLLLQSPSMRSAHLPIGYPIQANPTQNITGQLEGYLFILRMFITSTHFNESAKYSKLCF